MNRTSNTAAAGVNPKSILALSPARRNIRHGVGSLSAHSVGLPSAGAFGLAGAKRLPTGWRSYSSPALTFFSTWQFPDEHLASIGNVTIIESDCGEISGELEFYQDDLTGQNNSFVSDFSGLQTNAEYAPGLVVQVKKRLAPVVRLDEFFANRGMQPDFVKIDTEGYELTVLKGCQGLLAADKRPPKFMVEVQADGEEIYQFFISIGYKIYSSAGKQIIDAQNMRGNLFMLHSNDHSIEAERWLNHQAAI